MYGLVRRMAFLSGVFHLQLDDAPVPFHEGNLHRDVASVSHSPTLHVANHGGIFVQLDDFVPLESALAVRPAVHVYGDNETGSAFGVLLAFQVNRLHNSLNVAFQAVVEVMGTNAVADFGNVLKLQHGGCLDRIAS
jgi:hypothetical protein